MIEVVGWVGSIMFALCGLPQAIVSYKEGHSKGLHNWFLWLWFGGEILTICYVVMKHGLDLPLLTNYTVNLMCLIVILKYKYFER